MINILLKKFEKKYPNDYDFGEAMRKLTKDEKIMKDLEILEKSKKPEAEYIIRAEDEILDTIEKKYL